MKGQCNCGRPIRYTHFVNGEEAYSCNKHSVCDTYEVLESKLEMLSKRFNKLLEASGDVITFREGTDHYISAKAIIKEEQERCHRVGKFYEY